MQLSTVVTASKDVVAQEVGGEMVLLDLASGQYFGLDKVGGRIWELLTEGPLSLGDLCETIETEFDAPRVAIEADMLALATSLGEQGLIFAKVD
ncbi:PqqD family peptide modification chaperone [uncultured Erythrobacter sp.]|uniref:PqqD family peptide modification chaperone n=1 Tax=uncultured Erythrobacter sp. TaxID=263913 RepID=UPI002609CA60|nr:PqqD family peptide modification chaperone [uncultured Erythrobacter sp.]